MQLSELQALTASLCNDPSNSRYLLSDINQELDNTQSQWNAEVKIIRATSTFPPVANQRAYPLADIETLIDGTPISFPRATHKGIDLKKRSKNYFDLYTSYDWTTVKGTPTDFLVEAVDPSNLFFVVYPMPQDNDTNGDFVLEIVIAHTPMAAATDVPFMHHFISNNLLRPYDFYIAYSAASRLLARDPTPENAARMASYQKIGHTGKDLLIGVFKELEAEEPRRMTGGRQW